MSVVHIYSVKNKEHVHIYKRGMKLIRQVFVDDNNNDNHIDNPYICYIFVHVFKIIIYIYCDYTHNFDCAVLY